MERFLKAMDHRWVGLAIGIAGALWALLVPPLFPWEARHQAKITSSWQKIFPGATERTIRLAIAAGFLVVGVLLFLFWDQ